MVTRVAVSGIPAHWMRNISGKSATHDTLYNEVTPRVSSRQHVEHELTRIANTGNYLIGEGLRRALSGVKIQHFPFPWFWGSDGQQLIDYINKNFDAFVFGTANIFHRANNPSRETELFRRLRLPITVMSAGIQNTDDFNSTYPEQFRPFLQVVKEQNVAVFTRGHETAAFLRTQGVQFAEPVGCPSLYAFPNNIRRSLRRLKGVPDLSSATIVHSGYLGSVKDTVVDINALGGRAETALYVAQDEIKLFDYKIDASSDAAIYDDATGQITGKVSFPGHEAVKKHLTHFIFFNTEQWRAWISRHDLSFGRRFHGGVIAAQAGIPSVWLAVDDRTREMLKFIRFPHLESSPWNREPDKQRCLADFVRSFDAEQAVAHYNSCQERFYSLLKQLKLRN